MSTVSKEERAEMRTRCDAATDGPWMQGRHVGEPRAIVPVSAPMRSLLALDGDGMAVFDRVEDADFVVAARESMPRLLDDLEAAEAEIAELRRRLGLYTSAADNAREVWKRAPPSEPDGEPSAGDVDDAVVAASEP